MIVYAAGLLQHSQCMPGACHSPSCDEGRGLQLSSLLTAACFCLAEQRVQWHIGLGLGGSRIRLTLLLA